jgi:membrane fusion protein (multidrug efflux system)
VSLLGVVPASGQQPIPVIVKAVAFDRFVDRVEALGTLRANETVELTATVSETVTVVHFEDGQRVEAGSILVEMTNEEEHAQIEEELSKVAEAKKQYDRVRPPGPARSGIHIAARPAAAGVRNRQGPAPGIESKLQDRLITAPFAGVVGFAQYQRGRTHRAG